MFSTYLHAAFCYLMLLQYFAPPQVLAFFNCVFSFTLLSLPSVPFQTPEELDDSDFETEDFDVRSRTSVQTEDDQLIAGQSARVSCTSFLVVSADVHILSFSGLKLSYTISNTLFERLKGETSMQYIQDEHLCFFYCIYSTAFCRSDAWRQVILIYKHVLFASSAGLNIAQ